MTTPAAFTARPLGFPWVTRDPFLFCVHHLDIYPEGNDRLGLGPTQLSGRRIGMDFELKDGFRMYHGEVVPGFPAHPHRGFETITVTRQGCIDHSDSLGAAARYGNGDVQWMTAGRGIVHCEMFPLLERESKNPGELFQLWLNLPAKNKMVDPHFAMFWAPEIPVVTSRDGAGRGRSVTVVAGTFGDARAPAPPPNSWAASTEADVAIWTIALEPEAELDLPAGGPHSLRSLYFFEGAKLKVGDRTLTAHAACEFDGAPAVRLVAGPTKTELLMLQGRPIGEPVAHHGPFVMNTPTEIHQAIADYRATRFGGWPWPAEEHVHPRDAGRFARYVDGRTERPPTG